MERKIVHNRKVHITEGCVNFIQNSKWDPTRETTVIYGHDFFWGQQDLKLDYLEDDFVAMNVSNCIMLCPNEIKALIDKMPKHPKRTLNTTK
jgi:hypothetical protein